jgi:hypothetical protein
LCVKLPAYSNVGLALTKILIGSGTQKKNHKKDSAVEAAAIGIPVSQCRSFF